MRFLSVIFGLCIAMFSCVVTAQGGGAPLSMKLNWFIPSLRENGSVLPLAEIGGYELRYRLKGTSKFKSLIIRGASNRSYLVRGLATGAYEFQIATFDADGLYSKFVAINYKLAY